ncbi:MAG: putative metal-dependent hydrolase, TIM-barrel fold [Chloroflexi bacterium]|nr:MAG: putative metal-dependent hydrolase, TIM-barrel fold [Chloroflexota bacterium]
MLTIDCQVHAYERDRPQRPWAGTLVGPAEVTGDDMVAAMDAVGVDGALLVSPYSMYRYDPSYALEVHARHPGRFGLIRPFDPEASNVGDEVAHWAATPGAVGARIMLSDGYSDGDVSADHAGLNQILAAGATNDIPINVLCWRKLDLVAALARRHPNTQIVIDHLGLTQPFQPPPPQQPFADLPNVVALAALDNVAIKVSGACTLSHQPFPYDDIWEPLGHIFRAFGFERCMWGTDWTRAVELLTHAQGVEAFRVTDQLTESERAALMGGSLARIYAWTPSH